METQGAALPTSPVTTRRTWDGLGTNVQRKMRKPWRREGHEWLGRSVRRFFWLVHEERWHVADGVAVSWLPAEGAYAALEPAAASARPRRRSCCSAALLLLLLLSVRGLEPRHGQAWTSRCGTCGTTTATRRTRQ